MKQGILGFLVGCTLIFAIFRLAVIPQVNHVEQTQDQGLSLLQQRNAAQLKQIQTLQEQIQSVTTEKDTCQNKFNRGTFLYEQAFLGGPSREWFLPVDVAPVYLGQKKGVFTHYDQKTQVETVQFQAKTQ